ncbi:MAG: SDR family NAD(P)-dependent oxidoreductase [Kouleothrix sp.]|nr:SDR family NAD(P)-dependent oxidoreductase [Kouleothrix sp.]
MATKRLFDVIVALVGLTLLIPAFLIIAIAIKLDARGPVFYRARRIGRGGRPFGMYKFRTMVTGADRAGPALTYRDDPRVTRVGRLLRDVRLDELPQLINVLTGEMSLVGPRPEAPAYVRLDQPIWREVLAVRPGICGLAQLDYAVDEASILTSGATVEEDYITRILPGKLAIDRRYIATRSLLFDLKILWQTLLVLFWPVRQAPADGYGAEMPSGGRGGQLARRALARFTLPLMALDVASVLVSFWLAMEFRFDGWIPASELRILLQAFPFIVLIFISSNLFFSLYRYVWRYTSAGAIRLIVMASALSTTVLLWGVAQWPAARPVPLSVALLGGIFACGMFVTVRYRERLLTGSMGRLQLLVGSPDRQRVLIVGAGAAGHMLARQIQSEEGRRRYELAGFVDDDPGKRYKDTHTGRVLGDRSAIPRLVAERNVSLIMIAIHKISGADLRDILTICLRTPARVKLLPDFLGALDRPAGALPLRDIGAEDLLGRELCEVDQEACRELVAGKVVLVTGAAGSIGSELCRQVLALNPRRLLLVDNNETGLHDLAIALRDSRPGQVEPLVADVTNQARLESIFALHHPQVVFHAAAYKHVPMMELHPDEAVRVNVLGTAVVSDLAARHAVERFVFISTDKAVNPASVMGASKRVGELLMVSRAEQAAEEGRPTKFTAVRFGNVLGSRGSVAPTFSRQIEQGGPVTVTHPAMTRFFISITEAVSLVIQAATQTAGGDIFMLDMGQPIRIEDLAHKMIRLRGLRPGADIPIAYTGVRPGEKLHEELHTAEERQLATAHAKIFRILGARALDGAELTLRVTQLIELAYAQRTGELVADLWALVRPGLGAPQPLHAELLDMTRPEPRRPVELARELGSVVR